MGSVPSIKPPFRLICCCLSLGLLILTAGCGGTPRSVDSAEVSGKVMFQGKPLPGGRVAFVAAQGGFSASAIIKEDGTYQIKAPVGEVKIGVDNTMLRAGGAGGAKGAKGGSSGGPAKGKRGPRQPGASEPEEQIITGKYEPVPLNYVDPATSGLTYTVTKGSQTHDIELSTSSSTGGAAR